MSNHFNVTIQIDTQVAKSDNPWAKDTQTHCESAVVGPGCKYPDIAAFVNHKRPEDGSVTILLAIPVSAPASESDIQADQEVVPATYDAEFWKKHANPNYDLQAAYKYAASLPVTGFNGGGYMGFEKFFTDKDSAAAQSARFLEVENQGNGVFAFYSSEESRASLFMDATDSNDKRKNEELVIVLKRVLDDIIKKGWAWGN